MMHAVLSRLRLWRALRRVDVLRNHDAPLETIIDTLQEALRLAEAAWGENTALTATLLKYLGELYIEAGNPTAEPCLQRALTVTRQVYGPRHPHVAAVLNSLGRVLKLLMRIDAAEACYQHAFDLDTALYGADHPETLIDLNNLALLWMDHPDADRQTLSKARSALQIIRALNRQRLEPGHPDIVQDHVNWGALLVRENDWSGAERELRRAVELREHYSANPVALAFALLNLAGIIEEQGTARQEEVLTLRQRALQLDERVLGSSHPNIAFDLASLARSHVRMGDPNTAFDLLQRAEQSGERLTGQVFTISSESQRLAYLQKMASSLHEILSLVLTHLRHSPAAVQAGLDLVLRRKALGVEAWAAQRDAVLGGRYPDLAPHLHALRVLRERIAQAMLAGPGSEGAQAHEQRLEQWHTDKERLEGELARQIPEITLEQQLRVVDRQTVAHLLPAGTVLIEFVRCKVVNFAAIPAQDEPWWLPARYVAFVLPAGAPDHVQLVDLGEAELIDQLIETFRTTIQEAGRGAQRDLGALPPVDPGADIQVGTLLRQTVFDPLVEACGERRSLFLAPDSELTQLPFEVLPLDNGRFVLDEYHISYLSTGRDLLRFGGTTLPTSLAAIVVADPDFDLEDDTLASPPGAPKPEHQNQPRQPFVARLFRHDRSTSPTRLASQHARQLPFVATTAEAHHVLRDLGSQPFTRLLGTKIEGEEIAARLHVHPWLGREVLDERLKACQAPRILHLATHAFFLPTAESDYAEEWREGVRHGQLGGRRECLIRRMENPMLRAGLALAGANTWLQARPLPRAAEDGLLTAEEVSGLDLRATELVVLSACGTGVGDVRAGEGVFGLRRAFVLAGVKTLIISLWQVDDLAIAVLMTRFYDNLLDRAFTCPVALQEAQVWTRNVTIGDLRAFWLSEEMIARMFAENEHYARHLQYLRHQPDDYHPFRSAFYWGAFVCQGDPTTRLSSHNGDRQEEAQPESQRQV